MMIIKLTISRWFEFWMHRIAFDTSGESEIWKVDPNGTDLARVTPAASDAIAEVADEADTREPHIEIRVDIFVNDRAPPKSQKSKL
jgi:hypothetical protein